MVEGRVAGDGVVLEDDDPKEDKQPGDDAEAHASSSWPALAGLLTEATPDVMTADEHRRRMDLVRQRLPLLGDGLPAVRIGRFVLLELVGAGAMSLVYAAYDKELDRQVAVKLLRTPRASIDGRLRREAQALARLSHPNVVAVYQGGHWQGQPFIVMELVKGQTLETWLTASRRTWKDIVEVFIQAGRGLAAAHDLGFVHRDFKPANVMVGEDGRARVLDFGLVRLIEQGGAPEADRGDAARREVPPSSGSRTATGAFLGTPAYAAPEQRAGGVADARSDQYSFCVALREAISGVQPDRAPAERRARRERHAPARLSRAIGRGLDEDPRARWPSMRQLLGELERLRWPAWRWRLLAAVLGMAALIGLVVVTARHMVTEEQRARAALEQQAEHKRVLAHDARLVMAAQWLIERDPTAAAAALREVRYPDKASGWRSMATAVLLEPLSRAVVRGLDASDYGVVFDRDGSHVLALSADSDVLVWRMDGSGALARLHLEPGSIASPSPDRDWVLSWVPHGTRVVLSRTDGSEQRALGMLGERVASAIFTGTAMDIVTVSTEGVVRLWRSGRSQVLRTLRAPHGESAIDDTSRWGLTLGHSGRTVTSWTLSGAMWMWRTQGTQPPVRVVPPGHRPQYWQFSPDERWLAVTTLERDLKLWDIGAGGSPRVLQKGATGLDFSPDSRWLAAGARDGTTRIWPLDGSGSAVMLRGHTEPVISVRFDPEGRRVVTTSRDRTARVWNRDGNGDVIVLRGHAHHVASAVFSPDGRQIVTLGREPTLRLWDVSRRQVRILGRHDDKIWSASLDPDGRRLVTAGTDGTARIFHLDGARPSIVLRGHQDRQLYTALFSPDGRRVATGAADGTARIWNADGSGPPRVLDGHSGWVYGMAFSRDGHWLATGSKDGEVRLSPVEGPGPSRVLERGCALRVGTRVHYLIFGPQGDRLAANAAGCEGKPVLLWTGGEQRRGALGTAKYDLTMLAMSPRGRIATGQKDGSLHVWSADGDPLAILRGHVAELHDLAFSRDGRRLLSASLDGSARIWDLEHQGAPIILRGHRDGVSKAAFDADERRVVTASSDGTARVWRLDEPDQPIVLRGHEDDVRFAGFTPEGRVVTASFDGTVRLWSLDEVAADVPALMEQLRRATTVCLTADQRMHHLEESAPVAAEHFADCERAAGRPPVPVTATASPSSPRGG